MSKKRGNRKNDFDDDFDDTASKVSSIAESDKSSKKKGKGKKQRDDSDDELPIPAPAPKKSEKVNKSNSSDVQYGLSLMVFEFNCSQLCRKRAKETGGAMMMMRMI